MKVLAAANTTVCWVGEDSLLFYAIGQSPTSDTRNMRHQIELATRPESRAIVARRMFSDRFPDMDVSSASIHDLMGKEGIRVKALYEQMASKYGVGWSGRKYVPGHFEMSDITNKILTAANTALYALVLFAIVSLGYSPHVGFVHTGSPLPFVYDIADLYKADLCIDFAFRMTEMTGGDYDRMLLLDEFRQSVSEYDLLAKLPVDIRRVLGEGKK